MKLARLHCCMLLGCAATLVAMLSSCAQPESGSYEFNVLPVIVPDATLAAQVPTRIRESGELSVATAPFYPPLEFTDGNRLVGLDIDLVRAIAATLELQADFTTSIPYSTIIPSVAIGRHDLGISAFWADNTTATLTPMVTYLRAGVQFAAPTAANTTISTLADMCGLSVALEEGTEFIDELVEASAACRQSGKRRISIVTTNDQQEATDLVTRGKTDTMLADSPATTYAVDTSGGALTIASRQFELRDYGIAVSPQDAGLPELIAAALRRLIESGNYGRILARWNVQDTAISEPRVIPSRHAELLDTPTSRPPR